MRQHVARQREAQHHAKHAARCWHLQRQPGLRLFLRFASTRQHSVVPYAFDTFGQNVQQVAPHELLALEPFYTLATLIVSIKGVGLEFTRGN